MTRAHNNYKNLLIRILYFFSVCIFVVYIGGCADKVINISSAYHDVAAHYNSYYYAQKAIDKVKRLVEDSHNNDYNSIPPLYLKIDSALAITYKKDTEEAIKMASLSIKRHPQSRWAYKNYVLVGLARMYEGDFQNAIHTFKYVNTKARQNDVKQASLIHLGRTFIEQNRYDDAASTLNFLKKQRLNKKNKKKFYFIKAYLHQIKSEYDSMAKSLATIKGLLNKKDNQGRIYLIMGQVYQKLKMDTEAFRLYKECIATNSSYDVEFYARLGLLQTKPLKRKQQTKQMWEKFIKMSKDKKNVEFQGKIYYEMGVFKEKRSLDDEAIHHYQLAAHSGDSKYVRGQAYQKLGEICFNKLKEYEKAKYYYDSAIQNFTPNYSQYQSIQKKKQSLDKFVDYINKIKWNDSLMYLASLDTAILRMKIKALLVAKEKKDEEATNRRQDFHTPFSTNEKKENNQEWYFENPSVVALGQSEFQKIWGNITLEDNWRRSSKNADYTNEEEKKAESLSGQKQTTKPIQTTKIDIDAEMVNIMKKLPYNKEDSIKMSTETENIYFLLGDLLWNELSLDEYAIKTYTTILVKFNKSSRIPEALYRLCMIYNTQGKEQYDFYKKKLVVSYPDAEFTRILLDPDYLEKNQIKVNQQKKLYRNAYHYLKQGNIREADKLTQKALQMGESSFTSHLSLLQVLILGKTESLEKYHEALSSFITEYPEDSLVIYAKRLYSSIENDKEEFQAKNIRYTEANDEPHIFAIVVPQQNKLMIDLLKKAKISLKGNYTIEERILSQSYKILTISTFSNAHTAMSFLHLWEEKTEQPINTYQQSYTFVITKSNINVLYKSKGLNEYLAFFDRHYK